MRRSQVLDAPLLEPRMLRLYDGLGSVHGGSIVCAISRLGMDMWVIQLACLHHWSTVVCCYSTPLPPEPSPHTRRRSQCGQPLVSSRISSPSVYAQLRRRAAATARPGRKKGRIDIPLILPWLQVLPCPSLPSLHCRFVYEMAMPPCIRPLA